jgi:1,4-dihydroxy-2-naphthoate octaprenyltransferase
LLAPVFLAGWALGGGAFNATVIVAFLSLHVFLYGGATAFNSYYDRDEGPIGGLERPPPVVPDLLPFSLAMKAFGWLLALAVNPPFLVLYSSWVLFSLAYSHPRVRLKAHPVAALLSVGLFQGAVAFLAGWVAPHGDAGSALGSTGVTGAAAATAMLLGLYPLTQLHQMEEDRARGDRTVAVAWGPGVSFRLALGFQLLGGLLLLEVLSARFGAGDAVLVAFGLLAQLLLVWRWARRFDPTSVLLNYRTLMRLNTGGAATLAVYFLYRLARP